MTPHSSPNTDIEIRKISPGPSFPKRGVPNTYRAKFFLRFWIIPPLKKGDKGGFQSSRHDNQTRTT
jgi:hypothetical protein